LIASEAPGASYTFSNGITESSGAVTLGGTVNEDAYFDIDAAGLWFDDFGATAGSGIYVGVFDPPASVLLYARQTEIGKYGGPSFIFDNTDYIKASKIRYTGSFSLTNDRDIPDIGKVKSLIGSELTFSNGITNTSGAVKLGGDVDESALFTVTDGNAFSISAGVANFVISWADGIDPGLVFMSVLVDSVEYSFGSYGYGGFEFTGGPVTYANDYDFTGREIPDCNYVEARAKLGKFDATAAPGTGNDNTQGYSVGSDWIDVTNDDAYKCLDASTGAAVWKKTTP
jgi:hypothetical protein